MKIIILLLLATCAGCSSSHPLTECRGTFRQANPGQWTPTPSEMSLKAVP